MQFPTARILIFAKAPEPGCVKTRLAPALGSEGAAALYRKLLIFRVAALAAARLAPMELWGWPDAEHPLFVDLEGRYGVTRHPQQGANLGARMLDALRAGLSRGERVVLIGADCPALDASHLVPKFEALETHDAVLGPAEDGRYVLLGLRRVDESLFESMPWGGSEVAELTRLRMRVLRWRWLELAPLWDLDCPEDLSRLAGVAGWESGSTS